MMLSIHQYLAMVDRAWRSRDGVTLSELLSLKDKHTANSVLRIENPETLVESNVESPIDEIVSLHLRCLFLLHEKEYLEAYKCQSLATQVLTKILQSQKEENWMLPVMYAICLDLRLLAQKCEGLRKVTDTPGELLERAAECLMGCFRVCAADNRSSEEDTKRLGMLNLVNQLFKVYFRINKLPLCKPLIKAIQSSAFKEHFSLSQQITYRYFVGRKAMFDSDYKAADEYLSFAFERCHKTAVRNKRMILIYLVPVKMLLGFMPSKAVLDKYDLLQFWDIVEAVKRGNIEKMDKVMDAHESFFINNGIYLILEKLKTVAYRNLFKKVYLISKTHQIPIASFTAAFHFVGKTDVDEDEAECIIANLIHEGKIKGYISHHHRKVVVSKQNPFPSLSSLSNNTATTQL